jgi:hypothetical protein
MLWVLFNTFAANNLSNTATFDPGIVALRVYKGHAVADGHSIDLTDKNGVVTPVVRVG